MPTNPMLSQNGQLSTHLQGLILCTVPPAPAFLRQVIVTQNHF